MNRSILIFLFGFLGILSFSKTSCAQIPLEWKENKIKINGELTLQKQNLIYHLPLKAGKYYQIDMVSPNPKLLDPFLRILDSGNKWLAEDDDSGANANARIILETKETAVYRIEAMSFGKGIGPFQLEIQELENTQQTRLASWEPQAQSFEQKEFWDQAVKIRAKILEQMIHFYGPKDWQTKNARWALNYDQFLLQAKSEDRIKSRHSDINLNFALEWNKEGKIKEALGKAQEALQIRTNLFGSDHPRTGTAALWVGYFLVDEGMFAEGEKYYRQCAEIRKKHLGENHPDFAVPLNNLGVLYYFQGDLFKAEPLYRQALEIRKKTLGENHPVFATNLNNLGALYFAQGDFEKAEETYRQSLKIREKVLGEKHTETTTTINNLAALFHSQRKYSLAEKYFLQVLEIRQTTLGEHHPATATSLHNLAALNKDQGNLAKAEQLYQQTIAIRLKSLGEDHPATALSISNLGNVYKVQGKLEKAEQFHQRARSIYLNILSPHHPDYARQLNALGELAHLQGNHKEAEAHFRQSWTILRRHLDDTAAIQSERQQLLMAESLRHLLDDYLSIAWNNSTPPEALATLILLSKGSVFVRLRRQRQMHEIQGRAGDSARILKDLDQVSRQLASLAGSEPIKGEQANWLKQLADLTDKKETLEAELSEQSTTFRKQKARENLTAEQLRDRMPADCALVDFYEYSHRSADINKKGDWIIEARLLAMILRKNRPITFVQLGPLQGIGEAVEKFRGTLRRGQPILYAKDSSLSLREKLWDPLTPHLKGIKTVLISPDGALTGLPFSALPGSKKNSYLLEEIQIGIVPVPSLLAEVLDRKPSQEEASLLLIGAVDYEAELHQLGAVVASQKGVRTGPAKKWLPLEGTRTEIAAIKDSFEQRFPEGKSRTLRGAQATEEALRKWSDQYRWLHIATHGFFAEPKTPWLGGQDPWKMEEGKNAAKIMGQHPGLLSGLVFAGANREFNPFGEDGILTSLEVQALDLHRVDMVVLSACETGFGKLAGGEGVLGLQRAFQIAGAKTTITSLWSVDDKATQQLMVRFYENTWEKKLPSLEALVEAQRWMLREGLSRGMARVEEKTESSRTPPYYWGAFILSGDWR